jgi:hypothetical protein
MKKVLLLILVVELFYLNYGISKNYIDTPLLPDSNSVNYNNEIGLFASYDLNNSGGFGFYGKHKFIGMSIGLNKFDDVKKPSNYQDYNIPHNDYYTKEFKTAKYYVLIDFYINIIKEIELFGSIGAQAQETSVNPISRATGWSYKALSKKETSHLTGGGGLNIAIKENIALRLGFINKLGFNIGVATKF